MATNSVASAVPAYLYDYADQTTQRNDNINYLTVPLGPGGG